MIFVEDFWVDEVKDEFRLRRSNPQQSCMVSIQSIIQTAITE